MSLDAQITAAMASVPECIAAGYVDMSTGMLMSVRTLETHPQEVLDMVAAATADLFQGPTVSEIERRFKRERGLPPNREIRYFKEMLVLSENLIHVFLRAPSHPDHAAVFVTRRTANVGMVLTKARMSMQALGEAVQGPAAG
ncbi:hypothetical protein [Albimonas pacifica]|uniref:Roadblock/LAMTOR2 domain-containing protein n=1 Tax=Albimonas pacifica TaxID=1114924 RepID=A0A1I3BTN2_9RHOB|nr:hypothetical protein [Albimonas pacifica]SFH65645.1 hypothetical protein SAMN05216258_101335 [Albimonas pacifica]